MVSSPKSSTRRILKEMNGSVTVQQVYQGVDCALSVRDNFRSDLGEVFFACINGEIGMPRPRQSLMYSD
jgi:hypothetical protein